MTTQDPAVPDPAAVPAPDSDPTMPYDDEREAENVPPYPEGEADEPDE